MIPVLHDRLCAHAGLVRRRWTCAPRGLKLPHRRWSPGEEYIRSVPVRSPMTRALLVRLPLLCLAALWSSGPANAQRIDALGPRVRKYVSVSTSRVVLEHVQIIDGTGAALPF